MMRLISAALFAALNLQTNAIIFDPTAYAMEHEVQGHPYFILANDEIEHQWHIFTTKCGPCDYLGPLWAEIMKCYEKDEKVYVGKIMANTPPFVFKEGTSYWSTVTVDGIHVGDPHASNVTREYEVPFMFYGGDALAPVKYNGLYDRFSLYKFLEGHLGPCCGPKNPELCHDKAERTKMEKLGAKSVSDLLSLQETILTKDAQSELKYEESHVALMDETEAIDEAGNLSAQMKVDLQRKFGEIEAYRRKEFQGIDSAVASIRRALDAKGHEVAVDEDEVHRRADQFRYDNGEGEYD